jgi:hypothetical protein
MKLMLSMVVVGAFVATNAQAQDGLGRWKLGGDGSCAYDATDGGPNQCQPTPAVVKQEIDRQIFTVAAEGAALCAEEAGDDQDKKWACNEAIAGGIVVYVIYSGGSNVPADIAAGYCGCAELYYGISNLLWTWGGWASAQWDDWWFTTQARIMNAVFQVNY